MASTSSDGAGIQATFDRGDAEQAAGSETGRGGARTAAPEPGELVEHVHPGDVVWFVHRQIHAHVTAPDGSVPAADERTTPLKQLRVEWLDGYGPGASTTVSVTALDRLARRGDLRVVHAGVEAPAERWAGAYLERHPDADVNRCSTAPLAPRVLADSHTIRREWSRGLINGLLEHPLGDHRLGRRQFVRAAWTARRPDGRPSAVAVVTRPNAPAQADGRTLELARYVSHPDAELSRVGTNNTATWLLARVARWARLEGFDRLLSYSGVAGNDGGIYQGLPFEHVGWTDADPERWASREGRAAADTVDERKKRWVWSLHDTSLPVTRRAAARDAAQTDLSAFAGPPPVDTRQPTNFALCREERPHGTDEASSEAASVASDPLPVSDRARELFATAGPDDALERVTCGRRCRPGDDKPPAVFGADVDGTLVAALAVAGDPLVDSSAQIVAYAAQETPWANNTARWLAARAVRWAPLAGYRGLATANEAFAQASAPADILQ